MLWVQLHSFTMWCSFLWDEVSAKQALWAWNCCESPARLGIKTQSRNSVGLTRLCKSASLQVRNSASPQLSTLQRVCVRDSFKIVLLRLCRLNLDFRSFSLLALYSRMNWATVLRASACLLGWRSFSMSTISPMIELLLLRASCSIPSWMRSRTTTGPLHVAVFAVARCMEFILNNLVKLAKSILSLNSIEDSQCPMLDWESLWDKQIWSCHGRTSLKYGQTYIIHLWLIPSVVLFRCWVSFLWSVLTKSLRICWTFCPDKPKHSQSALGTIDSKVVFFVAPWKDPRASHAGAIDAFVFEIPSKPFQFHHHP